MIRFNSAKMFKRLHVLLCMLLAVALLAGCAGAPNPSAATAAPDASAGVTQTKPPEAAEATPQPTPEATPQPRMAVNIAALKGPTGIGMVQVMQQADAGETANDYAFTLAASPDEAVGLLTSGGADIAAVPTNLAAVLYNKTGGKVQMAAVNTLGVLYILENGDSIQSVADLKGKTIVASGKGATPEYALNYILAANGIDPEKDVTVDYKAEHAEALTLLVSGQADIALLPEPNVTAALAKSDRLRIALNLTQLWDEAAALSGAEQSVMAMGCLVVRTEFAQQNPEAVAAFLKEYKASTEYVTANVQEAAALVEKYGILPSAAVAAKAIPNCNIVYVDGEAMKQQLEGFYQVLFEANPSSVGGTLPDEAFYYLP